MGETSTSPVGVVLPLPHGRCVRCIDGTGTCTEAIGLNSGSRSLAMSRRRLYRVLVKQRHPERSRYARVVEAMNIPPNLVALYT